MLTLKKEKNAVKVYNKRRFEAMVVFDDDSIRRMFRMEARIYERSHRLTQLLLAVILISMALFMRLPTMASVLCLMIGSFLVFAQNFRCDMQAERVLQARHGAVSSVRCIFNEDRVSVGDGRAYQLREIERLVKEDGYYYIFWDRQTAVMVPKEELKPKQPEKFEQFLSSAAGRQWQEPQRLLWLKWKDFVQIFQDKALPWLGR